MSSRQSSPPECVVPTAPSVESRTSERLDEIDDRLEDLELDQVESEIRAAAQEARIGVLEKALVETRKMLDGVLGRTLRVEEAVDDVEIVTKSPAVKDLVRKKNDELDFKRGRSLDMTRVGARLALPQLGTKVRISLNYALLLLFLVGLNWKGIKGILSFVTATLTAFHKVGGSKDSYGWTTAVIGASLLAPWSTEVAELLGEKYSGFDPKKPYEKVLSFGPHKSYKAFKVKVKATGENKFAIPLAFIGAIFILILGGTFLFKNRTSTPPTCICPNRTIFEDIWTRPLSPPTTIFIEPPLPPIHITFTSSASYVTGLLAVINSTLVNASPSTRTRLQFHIVSSDGAEAGQVIELLEEHFGEQLEGKLTPYGLAETGDESLEHVKVWADYRSESLSKPIVFARFLVPDLLAKDIDRVIYLDQDVLVLHDLAELWDIDLEGHAFAAALNCGRQRPQSFGKNLIGRLFRSNTCSPDYGVLVYDLEAWRSWSPSFTDQLFHWTGLKSRFYRNYKVLDDKWNLMDIAGLREETDHGREQPWTRSRDEVASSAVLHWNGAVKPWMCNGEGYYSELWTAYFPDYKDFIADPDQVNELCETLVITQPHDPPAVEQFTVVIVSFMRVDMVIKIVQQLQRSPYVREIIVAWNNLDKPCPAELESFRLVRCFQQEDNLVSNRFLVWPNVTTEAVLHYDDDIIAPLEDLEAAFQIWRRHQDQILGFEPRVIVCDPEDDEDETPADGAYLPIVMGSELRKRSHKLTGCQYRVKLSSGYLDVVIGKLFFISRTFMRAYFQNAALLALSNSAPCEDIGMNFLAAHLSLPNPASSPPPRAPLLFKSNLTEIHSKLYYVLSQGISSTGWRGKRHDCVQELVGIFGAKPGEQRSFFERDEVSGSVYRLPIEGRMDAGWCSDTSGSRMCGSP